MRDEGLRCARGAIRQAVSWNSLDRRSPRSKAACGRIPGKGLVLPLVKKMEVPEVLLGVEVSLSAARFSRFGEPSRPGFLDRCFLSNSSDQTMSFRGRDALPCPVHRRRLDAVEPQRSDAARRITVSPPPFAHGPPRPGAFFLLPAERPRNLQPRVWLPSIHEGRMPGSATDRPADRRRPSR